MPIDPTDAELDYRAKNYQDPKAIDRKQIACATCGKNLSAKMDKPGGVFVHPFIATLQCKKCSDFYGDGDFSMDDDGDDKYCRICGNGGALFICGNKPCPYGFCQKCIDRYIGKNSAEVQADDWKCLHCNCKPLWEVRAVCALTILENSKKRWKHRKISTRGEVSDSDDDSRRSEDLVGHFQNSRRVTRRPLKSMGNSKLKKKTLNRLRQNSDGSNDSLDHSDMQNKFTASRKHSNTRSAYQSCAAKRNSAKLPRVDERFSASEDESSDLEEKHVIHRKNNHSKFQNPFVKLESKSVASRKQDKQKSIKSIKHEQETLHHSRKRPQASESPEGSKNSNTSEAESESSHESANDFVKSKKRKDLKTQTALFSKKNESKARSRDSNAKLGKIEFPYRKIRNAPPESKNKNCRTGVHSSKDLNPSRTKKKTEKSVTHTSDNDRKIDGRYKRVSPDRAGVLHARRKDELSTSSESDEHPKIRATVTKLSIADKQPSQASQTKRLSMKPVCPLSQNSSLFDDNNRFLDRRKASIKHAYAKFASSKDRVTSDEARQVKEHLGKMIHEIKIFGNSLCTGADGITKKHLANESTSVSVVSKTAFKCALLMIRCKKTLNIIENEFIESYENWCQSSQVKSLFSDLEDVDVAAGDKRDSFIERMSSSGISEKVIVERGSKADSIADKSTDDENCNINNQLSCSFFNPTSQPINSRLDDKLETLNSSGNLSESNCSEKLKKNSPEPKNRDSERGSRNSMHDILSDCDRDIFSDDEGGEQAEKSPEPGTKRIGEQSLTSKNRTIESESDDSGKNKDKSLQSEDVIGDSKNVAANKASISHLTQDILGKAIACSAEKCVERPSTVESTSEITQQASASMGDIFDKRASLELGTISDVEDKSKDSGDSDESVRNYLENTDHVYAREKSTPPETEVNRNNLNGVTTFDDEETLHMWDKSAVNKPNSELEASRHSLSTDAEEIVGGLSDCDATIIFTQSDAAANSDDDHIVESVGENLDRTKDSRTSNLLIDSDAEMLSQNDTDPEDPVNPPKKRSKSSETIVKRKGASGSDSDKSSKSTSDSPEIRKESSETEKVVEHSSTALSSNNKENNSGKGISAVGEDGTGESDHDNDSEEAIKKKMLESDTECSEDGEMEQATSLDKDLEEANKKKMLASDSECSEDGEKERTRPVEDYSEEVTRKKMLESDTECSENGEMEQTTSLDKDSEEAIKKKLLASDSECSEDGEMEQATSLDKDSEEAIKKKLLASDSECSEDGGKERSSPVDDYLEGVTRKKTLESDTEGTGDDGGKKQTTPVDDDSEDAIQKMTLELDSPSSEDCEKQQASRVDDGSEEAIRRKMLESDSEWSENSLAVSNNFKLEMNSDSDQNSKPAPHRQGAAGAASTIVTSEKPDASDKSQTLKIKTGKSMGSKIVDTDISALNNLAKQRLLSSSNSSDSDTDDTLLISPVHTNHSDSKSTSSQENYHTAQGSSSETGSTTPSYSKTKRRKFDVEKNPFYQTDKQLRTKCQVVVRRLDEKVLDQFRQLLGKSRERQEQENFQSLIDLKSIKKRKRGTKESNESDNSSKSSSSRTSSKANVKRAKSKQAQEKEETLLEHLEKMKNGETYCNPLGDDSDENDDDAVSKILQKDNAGEDEFLAEANKFAKDCLIQSSDSENEMQVLGGNAQEEEQEEEEDLEAKKPKKKKKDTDIPNAEAADSESNHENGSSTEKDKAEEETGNAEEDVDSKQEEEDSDSDRTRERKKLKEGLSGRNWRLTDSDSSGEEKKWNKSQEKKADEKGKKPKEAPKQKKKVKRRMLGSDSDSVKSTDGSDNSVEMIEEKKGSSSESSEDSAQLFKNLRTKRRRKKNAAQKSGSDSESEEDEKPTKQKRKRIKKMESDSDSDGLTNSQDTPGKLHRKNIRKVLKDKQVADVTKIAGKEEEERLKRIAERQKLYNEMYEMKLASEAKVDKLVLDFDEETKKELVSVHEGLVKRLKPHQAQGIKFMWDACFESLERIKTEKGSGCIVAHCMGLGKTFQVVTLAHTLLTHPETGIKTIMVICPLSTVLNWVNEFKKWLADINNDEDVEVFEMTKMKKNFERKYQLEKWKRAGGVMILGYEMFRLLSNQTGKKMRKSLHEGILKCLVDPGPDLIVCDEGHLLKNEDTALSKAMRRVKTLRRIVLTGTPLQNNLVEYHCMVQFVKPNLLGTKKEFLNRFVNPITNGQFDDSTEYDVKLMKKRAHVLHKMLEGSVQRFDYSVLTPFLPPKQEYVITVRLADIQIQLYQHYLDNFSRKKVGAGTSLFADFQALQRIWTHPIVLRMNAEKMEKINEKKRMDASDTEGSLVDFLDDGSDEKTTSSEDSDVQSCSSSEEKKEKPRRGTRSNPQSLVTANEEEEELQPQSGEWWSQFVEPHHFEDMKISSKLVLLFAILKECEQIGDKVLVFSQSLYALSLIEEFLSKIDDETQRGTCSELIDEHSGSWSLGLDYFRLDGQTPPENRSHYCKIFNNPKNSRARLFLISTRAGGLGINLTAANRVIIFDASWNPSHDVQSIFRIYRFGQRKPCYVYRFLAQGTMEEKIYNRQVTKLSLSCRVVDEQQIERHYSNHDLAELYQFEPNTSKEKPTLNLPKDRLLAEILRKYEDRIETFHEHDSLLENKAEEELDEEERKEAWKEYEDERTGRKVMMNNFAHQNFAMQQYNDMMNMNSADIANRATLSGINIDTLQALIRKDYPNSTPEQQKMMTQRAIIDMYTYMENEAIRQQQLAASNYAYPTVSNIGTSSFIDGNVTPAQRQYAMQQQQMHQIMVQREQQANYAKRFGNTRVPALAATATRPPPVVNLQDDSDIIEIPTSPPATTGPTPSSSVQAPSASAPAVAENSKRQEE